MGVYSRELLQAIISQHPEARHLLCYRPHRLRQSWSTAIPAQAHRRLLYGWFSPTSANLFHGLNQRLPAQRFRSTVCTFHDLFVLTGEYSTPDFRERFAAQAREAASRADLVIAVSQFTADQVSALLNVPTARIRVVPHGVSIPAEVPPLHGREPLILHVGAIQHRKNIARLLTAFERLRGSWRLVFAGSFGFGREELRDRIAQSSRREFIEVLGYISDTQLRQLYARARLLAFPSLDEGFGIPVLEAMSWGLPVLTSNRSALPEVSGGAARLVDPYSVEDITAGLEEQLQESQEVQQRIQRGLVWAAQHTWHRAAAQTWKVYKELLPTIPS